jgi:hypothetical protein
MTRLFWANLKYIMMKKRKIKKCLGPLSEFKLLNPKFKIVQIASNG